jgi:hypothetical protein
MVDKFLQSFGWITALLRERPTLAFFQPSSEEYAIINRLRGGWEKEDTAKLLRELTTEYGDRAGQAVEKYIEAIYSWIGPKREKRSA